MQAAAHGLDFGQFGHDAFTLRDGGDSAATQPRAMVARDGDRAWRNGAEKTTHFGFSEVPLGDKQGLVNDVFHIGRRAATT